MYCAGNPVKLVDPDGRKIRGFSVVGNQVVIGRRADKDVVRLFTAMSKFSKGRSAFLEMVKMDTKINLKLTSEENKSAMGETFGSRRLTKSGHYKRALICIYEGSITADDSRFYNLEEGLIAIGVHESVHLSPEQIQIDSSRDEDAEDANISLYYYNETAPMNAEYDARVQYSELQKEQGIEWSDDWKNSYESSKDRNGNEKPIWNGTEGN